MGWFTKRQPVAHTPATLRATWEATEEAERAQWQAQFEKWFHGRLVQVIDAGLAASASGQQRPSEWNVGTYGFTVVKNNLYWYQRPGVTVGTYDQYVSDRISPHYLGRGLTVNCEQEFGKETQQPCYYVDISY